MDDRIAVFTEKSSSQYVCGPQSVGTKVHDAFRQEYQSCGYHDSLLMCISLVVGEV